MKKTTFLILIILLMLTGCSSASLEKRAATLSAEQIQIWAQETVNAIVANNTEKTAVAVIPLPQATPTPKTIVIQPTLPVIAAPTSIPVMPTMSQPKPVQTVCDLMGFVNDVTVDDNSVMAPNQPFQKIWRIRNAGSCTWTTGYQFVFESGAQMSASPAINLPREVRPNEIIDIVVDMRAPAENGVHQGFWKMRNTSGTKFGTSLFGNDTVWVKIQVGTGGGGQPITGTTGGTCSILGIYPSANDSFSPNQDTDFWVTIRNDSAIEWTFSDFDLAYTGGSKLMKNPNDERRDMPLNIAPGSSFTFRMDALIPNTQGTFTMDWGVVRNYEIICPFQFTVRVR